MSRRKPIYIDSSFKYKGKEYSLIKPTSFSELMEALSVKDKIDDLINQMEPGDHQDAGLKLLNAQIYLMQEYVDELDSFDNTLFIKNINYLLKNRGLKIGELELLLGLSAGYISRTASKNSKKRMSIDIVWKVAELFNVDIKTLLETDLSLKNNNTALLIKFIQTLRKQIETHELIVEMFGGKTCFLNDRIHEAGIVHEVPGNFLYYPNRLSIKKEFYLANDVLGVSDFRDGKTLIIIPIQEKGWKDTFYELLLLDPNLEIESIFCTVEAPFEDLQLYAKLLYEEMREQEFDVDIKPEIKRMINDYLSDK